ncbi:hypothetical protein AcV7_002315 [Taiwanofungus camphoratus]|nr:hypothetical protein AcV7_002315 [Antrodia cinnamomea]
MACHTRPLRHTYSILQGRTDWWRVNSRRGRRGQGMPLAASRGLASKASVRCCSKLTRQWISSVTYTRPTTSERKAILASNTSQCVQFKNTLWM